MIGQFNTHPRAVKHWLDNLPIAHIGETSRQLYTAMSEVNRQEDVPVKQRFHFLEGVSEPLNMILPELHRHYAGKPLPLSKKRRKIADLYTQLLRQAILGYEQVIARAIELNRLGWKKVVTTSVHRIFHYSGLLLLNQRLLYQPYQKGLWQQLYWLYQMVESYKLLKVKVTCPDRPSCKTVRRLMKIMSATKSCATWILGSTSWPPANNCRTIRIILTHSHWIRISRQA